MSSLRVPLSERLLGRFSSAQTAFAGIFVVSFLGLVAIGATLPVLPLYVRGPIGAGDVSVGFVTGAFAFTGLAFRPFAGHLADVRGRRRVVVAGALITALAGGLYFVPAGVAGLIGARLVLGAGEAMVYSAGAAWVVDLAPANRHGRIIGIYGLAVWGGLALGAPFGEILLRATSFEVVWAFAAAAPLLGAVVASRIPETFRPREVERRGFRIPRETLIPGLGLSLGTVGFTTMSAFIVLHLDRLDIGHGAEVFTAFAISVVTVRLLGGTIPDRIGAERSAATAGVISALGLVTIAAAQSLEVALLGAVVMGSAFSLMFPSLALMVINRVPEERRGVALGTFTAFFDIGVAIGTPVAGAIAAISGYPAAFVFAAACALGLALVGLTAGRRAAPAAPEPEAAASWSRP